MPEFEYLRHEVADGIATVKLARPPVNSVSQAMYVEISTLFEEIQELGDVRAVVLAGEGKHFCAGNDLEEFRTMTPDNAGLRMMRVRRAFTAVQDCRVPVIAAVHGTAVGTGLALAAACDFIVAAEDASIGVPEVSVGVMGGARHLGRLMPQQYVRWMYLSGQPMSGAELERFGGVLTAVPADEVMAEARSRAEAIVKHSPVAVRFAKRSLNQIEFMDLKSGYQYEQSLTADLCGYPDAKEAVAAFFERREPRYTGD